MSSEFKRENSDLLLAFLTLLGIILLVAVVGFFMLHKGPDIVQGEVDVDEFRVSSKVPSRVLQLCVHEGDSVHVGDTVAIMEAPDVQAKLEQAQAAESAAQAQNQKAINGTRQEQIQGAYDMWQKSKAGVDIAVKTYNRVKNLNAEGVLPAQKLDEATAQRDAAIATEKAAHSQYTMAVNGAQREDKAAAAALVNRAKGAVAEVNSYIKETYLVSPCDGEVSETYPQLGELVGSGAPIMSISILKSKWVTFNVREDLLKDIKMGATIEAFVPALNNKVIKLKVYYLKDLGTYAAWKATKTTGQYDLKTFEVKARPLQYIPDLRPGMSVIINKK
jgi:HlyD family secretion protein